MSPNGVNISRLTCVYSSVTMEDELCTIVLPADVTEITISDRLKAWHVQSASNKSRPQKNDLSRNPKSGSSWSPRTLKFQQRLDLKLVSCSNFWKDLQLKQVQNQSHPCSIRAFINHLQFRFPESYLNFTCNAAMYSTKYLSISNVFVWLAWSTDRGEQHLLKMCVFEQKPATQ